MSPHKKRQTKTQDEAWLANYLVQGPNAYDSRKGHWSRWLAPPGHPVYKIRLAELQRLLSWPTWIVRVHIESWAVGGYIREVERGSQAKSYRYPQGGSLPTEMQAMEYQE